MATKRKRKMVSRHYQRKRSKREKFIDKHLNGDGKVIDSFIVDKGHKNGLERHDLTDNGIIIIYNARTNLLVSKLIARPNQIKRYYKDVDRNPPEYLIQLAQWHEDLQYNR